MCMPVEQMYACVADICLWERVSAREGLTAVCLIHRRAPFAGRDPLPQVFFPANDCSHQGLPRPTLARRLLRVGLAPTLRHLPWQS